ncbi:MAG: DUF362 domain-containing protein [Deferrisomatales bacterium]
MRDAPEAPPAREPVGMSGSFVSLLSCHAAEPSLRRALELCDGLAGWRTADRILIKPNLVEWDLRLPMAPWGVVTTTAVIAALVKALAQRGFRHLTVGEGSPLPYEAGKGREVFRRLGYRRLADRYGVRLVDFDEEPFEEVCAGDVRLSVARAALGSDRIITVPTLKTHGVCRVSLGIKNLKGCLSRGSKRRCHHPERDLNQIFPHLADLLPVALNVIDGTFALERGPTHTGRAHRRNVLVASPDVYAADAVGAHLLGYTPEEVPHLRYYAGLHRRPLDPAGFPLRGEALEAHRAPLDWQVPWREDDTGPLAFDKQAITGLAFRKPDDTLCTGCTLVIAPMLVMLMAAHRGESFGGLEIVTGKRRRAAAGFARTLLVGRCACRRNEDNPNIAERLEIPDCPATVEAFVRVMAGIGVRCEPEAYEAFRRRAFARYRAQDGFTMDPFAPPDAEAGGDR